MQQDLSLAQAFTPGYGRFNFILLRLQGRKRLGQEKHASKTVTKRAYKSIEWWTLFSFPAYTVLGVLEDDSARGQLITNLIRAIKVAAMTRFLALVNQRLDFVVEH